MSIEVEPRIAQHLADHMWRLSNLYWIIDQNKRRVKFRPNEAQRQLLEEMWFRNIIPKSRQHGVTTLACIYSLDQCLFVSNIRAGIIAHNEDDAEVIFRDKVKFPYDQLPDDLRACRPTKTDRKREMLFNNNSSIRVVPSGRSGTYNILHVSEFGRICLKHPEHAEEIVAGALEAVHAGNFVFIESTAHGRQGRFFEMCEEARNLQLAKKPLTKLDFKLHFFPWWMKPSNALSDPAAIIPARINEYLNALEAKIGRTLTTEQRTWYAKKEADLQEQMKSEHPSTYDECFEKSIEGAYYATQFRTMREKRQITAVPAFDGVLVDTWWDLGFNDMNCIWFTQTMGREVHVIDYYENCGEGLGHYRDVMDRKKYRYGTHTAPHDIEVHELSTGTTRLHAARSLGINFRVAPKMDLMDGIEAVRKFLSICWFDEANCGPGLEHLENYRKEWDDHLGTFKNRPLHDEHSHGADAFRTLATAHSIGARGTTGRRREIVRDVRSRIVV